MKPVSTRTHGYMDYIVGILLIVSPGLFNFSQGGAETWVPVILGIGSIGYSLMTNYEMGLMKSIPMPAHLWMDGIAGVFLALSPWIFNFADLVFLPHLIIGIAEAGLAMMTERYPSTAVAHQR